MGRKKKEKKGKEKKKKKKLKENDWKNGGQTQGKKIYWKRHKKLTKLLLGLFLYTKD